MEIAYSNRSDNGEELIPRLMQPNESNHKQLGCAGSRKRYIIIAVIVAIVLLIIILGTTLGIHSNQDDSSSVFQSVNISSKDDKLPNVTNVILPVLLISFDGFRVDYLDRGFTPNIINFGKSGVQAKFLVPEFPTKTFTTHYSIVTGLYPESHGIVFNKFYDPVLKKPFRKSTDPEFWRGEPIWVTAMKNGMKSASYFWVGSDVPGQESSYYFSYDGNVPFSARIEQVIEWLRIPKGDRPSIITVYFDEPDSAGHKFGPESDEINKQLKFVDNTFGQLITSLDENNMTNSVNIVLVTDHGLAATDCSKIIFLDQYNVTDNDVKWSNLGSVSSLNAVNGSYESVLQKIQCKSKRFQAFYKKRLPKRLHFSNNRRIDDIIVLSGSGELVALDNKTRSDVCENGTHGYDNLVVDMRGIFMARGPSFVRNKIVEHFSSIEIYNLLAALLRIEPKQNNGTVGSLNSLLVQAAKPSLKRFQGDGNRFRTDICQFPSPDVLSDTKYRVCWPCRVGVSEAKNADTLFNMTPEQAVDYQKFHLPWGLPDGGAGVEGCLTTQPAFIVGYSTYLRIPLWTANRINGTLSSTNLRRRDCFRNDVRFQKNQSANCNSYKHSGFDRGHMVPTADVDYNITTMLTTYTFANIVPQYPYFNQQIWRALEVKVRKWAVKYQSVYVISGSIFDVDGDGFRDDDRSPKMRTKDHPHNPVVPTHFYKIVTRCDPETSSEYVIQNCPGSLYVISFILPNTDKRLYCSGDLSFDDIFLQNVARVRDIELLTGTSFFSELRSLQLQAELKSFLPVKLWPSV